jgi:hypothetical protein
MRLLSFAAALLAVLSPLVADAGRDPTPSYANPWVRIEIYDRTDGRSLPVYIHENQMYVAGEPGHQYEIRLRNRSNERLLAVTSVDGVNVLNGETADSGQSGYVLAPWDSVDIEGWRKSMDQVATFYFTRRSNSYAARTGRPENVGVIGVAVFREHRHCCRYYSVPHPLPSESRAEALPEVPLAEAERDSSSEEAAAAPRRQSDQRLSDKLGTGHGHREDSPVEYVDFQRASRTPELTIAIYYDSKQNLLAQGVIREPRKYAGRPDPFPNEFVPDP